MNTVFTVNEEFFYKFWDILEDNEPNNKGQYLLLEEDLPFSVSSWTKDDFFSDIIKIDKAVLHEKGKKTIVDVYNPPDWFESPFVKKKEKLLLWLQIDKKKLRKLLLLFLDKFQKDELTISDKTIKSFEKHSEYIYKFFSDCLLEGFSPKKVEFEYLISDYYNFALLPVLLYLDSKKAITILKIKKDLFSNGCYKFLFSISPELQIQIQSDISSVKINNQEIMAKSERDFLGRSPEEYWLSFGDIKIDKDTFNCEIHKNKLNFNNLKTDEKKAIIVLSILIQNESITKNYYTNQKDFLAAYDEAKKGKLRNAKTKNSDSLLSRTRGVLRENGSGCTISSIAHDKKIKLVLP